jgi:glycosyltransferase involved in cell wall biosynthesis
MGQRSIKSVSITVGRYEESGIGNIVRNLSAELALRGYSVSIGVTSKGDIATAVPAGCQTFHFTDHPIMSRALGKIIPVNNINLDPLIHHHQGSLILKSLPFKESKVILHYHGVNPFSEASMRGKYEVKQLARFAPMAAARIAVSEFAKTELEDLLNIRSTIHVVYPGVDTNRFTADLPSKYRKGEPSFLFVGRLNKAKAVHNLIEAMIHVRKELPNAYLRIIGRGPRQGKLQQQIEKSNLLENVEVTPLVPLDELPFYYASCDAYASSSAWETFGLPVLEAMACGKPVVGPSAGSYPEIIKASQAGEIYQSGNTVDCATTMVHVAMNSRKYSNNARAFALKHTWQKMVDEIEEVYRDHSPV